MLDDGDSFGDSDFDDAVVVIGLEAYLHVPMFPINPIHTHYNDAST